MNRKKQANKALIRRRLIRPVWAVALIATVLLTTSVPLSAKTTWKPVSQGRLEIKNADLQAPKRLFKKEVPSVAPLKHTDVKIKVRGFVAEVTVTQEFSNPLSRPIEAEYVFPLPHDSAINATEMRIGKRVIRGKIDRRESARLKYEKARDQGKRASLLKQERPNIFTQSVANIGPNETIHVVIRYVQTLPYKDGAYEVVFPMVVGPRYIPGKPLRDERGRPMRRGNGRLPDTDRVPDASRITPPVIPPGRRCGFDISISVDIEAGVPIQKITSRAHAVTIKRDGESDAVVMLGREDAIPNKDFVLNIAVAGDQPEIGILAHANDKSGYFTMIIHPPKAPADDQIRPREIICVMDTSGSMSGKPIDLAKKAAVKLLKGLKPTDRFNIYVFSNDVSSFRPDPVDADDENIRAGINYVKNLRAAGGTEMLKGVRAALGKQIPESHMRMIVFLTDGYIGDEEAIFEEIKRNVGSARFFTFGIGSSVNRYLLDRMAFLGRGFFEVILLKDKPEEVINRFAKRIEKPVLTDAKVKITGVEVFDCLPACVPDLYAGMPVYVHGRYRKGGEATIEILGRIGKEPSGTKITFTFPGPTEDSSPLPSIWARRRIKQLELDKIGSGSNQTMADEITELALEYSLMSKYTSFVAIDETPTAFGGRPRLVPVAVPMPDGVCYETTIENPGLACGGRSSSGGGFSLGFPSSGGGPVGLITLMVIGVLAAMAVLRRRKEQTCRRKPSTS